MDRQREEQRGDQQCLDQKHRTKAEGSGLTPKPESGNQAAQPPLSILEQPNEQFQVSDGFVGDVMGGPLVDHITDGDEEGGAQCQQDGQIDLRHCSSLFYAPPVPVRPG